VVEGKALKHLNDMALPLGFGAFHSGLGELLLSSVTHRALTKTTTAFYSGRFTLQQFSRTASCTRNVLTTVQKNQTRANGLQEQRAEDKRIYLLLQTFFLKSLLETDLSKKSLAWRSPIPGQKVREPSPSFSIEPYFWMLSLSPSLAPSGYLFLPSCSILYSFLS
jgi:hypothetical protein